MGFLNKKTFIFFILIKAVSSESIFADSALNSQADVHQKWKLFKGKYGKVYASSVDEKKRFLIFKRNWRELQKMNDQNERVNGQRPYGMTKFLDLHPADFSKSYLSYNPNLSLRSIQPALAQLPANEVSLPKGIDWTMKGATGPVLNQGACGSCWAYSAIAQVETAVFMKTGFLPSLSVQQLVSCSRQNNGCQGGDTIAAYDYMLEAGIQSEDSYPYTSGSGATGNCEYDSQAVKTKIASWNYVVPGCDQDPSCNSQLALEPVLKQQVAVNGPASVCLHASSWQYYEGGVVASGCPSDKESMDHCVQLVGYDTDSNGSSYWILRNQWGKDWGEEGFIRLKMGSNVCGVVNEATTVTPQNAFHGEKKEDRAT